MGIQKLALWQFPAHFYYHVALKPIFVVIKFFTFFQQCGFLPLPGRD